MFSYSNTLILRLSSPMSLSFYIMSDRMYFGLQNLKTLKPYENKQALTVFMWQSQLMPSEP